MSVKKQMHWATSTCQVCMLSCPKPSMGNLVGNRAVSMGLDASRRVELIWGVSAHSEHFSCRSHLQVGLQTIACDESVRHEGVADPAAGLFLFEQVKH